jgi:hypothetical protein
VTTLDADEMSHAWPRFLPGGRQFLYYAKSLNPLVRGIYIGSLDHVAGRRLLLNTISIGVFLPGRGTLDGYLLWPKNDNRMAQPFNGAEVKLSGEPELLLCRRLPGNRSGSMGSAHDR